MIEYKTEFTKRGTRFIQIYKDKALVVYQLDHYYDEYGVTTHNYEVFKYTVHTPDKYHNEEYELYPSDSSFGFWAWSCSDEKSVNKILKKHFPNHPMTKIGLKCSDCSGVCSTIASNVKNI